MCRLIPVSQLVELPVNWIRSNDARLAPILESLSNGDGIDKPIDLIRCGCGKTYMLKDGGHRITAANTIWKTTGKDLVLRVHEHVADFQ